MWVVVDCCNFRSQILVELFCGSLNILFWMYRFSLFHIFSFFRSSLAPSAFILLSIVLFPWHLLLYILKNFPLFCVQFDIIRTRVWFSNYGQLSSPIAYLSLYSDFPRVFIPSVFTIFARCSKLFCNNCCCIIYQVVYICYYYKQFSPCLSNTVDNIARNTQRLHVNVH
jgi:hypothetical protein